MKTTPEGVALLTAGQAAQYLNVSLRTIRRLIAAGSLPVVRIGRAVRIRPASLTAMTESDRR